jgi:hypothetical protein
MANFRVVLCVAAAIAALPAGCNDSKESGGTTTTGGTAATGGAMGAGGSGTAGANAAGGKTGAPATGGSSPATGGALATGGSAMTGGTQSSGGTAGSTSGSTWRPFNDQSPWNTKIPANPEIDPDSDALVADFASNGGVWININDYGIPAYYADVGTPLQTVTVVPGIAGAGFAGNKAQVPIPAGAVPDPESDHHMCVVDRGKRTA